MLNKDDLFELEKALDIYASWMTESLNKYCQTALHYDATKKNNPMEEVVKDMIRSRNRIKQIRDKLTSMRNNCLCKSKKRVTE